MANGRTVELKAGGETYRFRLTVNEIIGLQTAFGVEKDEDFLAQLGEKLVSLPNLRMVLFYGLKGQHEDMTEEMAGDVMTEMGGLVAVGAFIRDALAWTLPPKVEGAGKPGKNEKKDRSAGVTTS